MSKEADLIRAEIPGVEISFAMNADSKAGAAPRQMCDGQTGRLRVTGEAGGVGSFQLQNPACERMHFTPMSPVYFMAGIHLRTRKSVAPFLSLMDGAPSILITADDDGHAFLAEEGLCSAGGWAPSLRFPNGQETLDFLFGKPAEPSFERSQPYLLRLDIRMPQVDGVKALRQIKTHPELRKLPVMMLTTVENPREFGRSCELGCNNYVQKPVSFDSLATANE